MERLVRSCIKELFAVLSSRRFTEETLSTNRCFVEQIPKARPLRVISFDPQVFQAFKL